jgi:hypothetical protein
MHPTEYFPLAMRTADLDATPASRLGNAALGLAGEFGEIVLLGLNDHDEAIKECGDQLWYVAQACSATGIDFCGIVCRARMFPFRPLLTAVVTAIADVAEIAKKALYHDHPIGPGHLDTIGYALARIVANLDAVLQHHGATLEEAMALNIEKLRRRYPDGFSAERSINREA